MPTLAALLQKSTAELAAAGITTARLDCLVLLEDILHVDRAQLLAEPELEITPEQLNALQALLNRRAKHEPLAYLRKKTEFYGREFYVDHHVLEPRSESETMIDLLLAAELPANATIIDVGTGSGALAITAKLESPDTNVFGIDVDPDCLAVAEHNSATLNASVNFLKGNLLEPFTAPHTLHPIPSVLLCNLPYVPDDFPINQAATHEPKLALFGGPDGLDLYRSLFEQLQKQTVSPLLVFTESLRLQHEALANIARSANYELLQTEDFIQVFRTSSAAHS